MNAINELLKRQHIHSTRYEQRGKCMIATGDDKVVIKPHKTDIYAYLDYRNFNHYPAFQIDDGYEISEYIEDVDIPREQKMIDLITLTASLHKKTTYYKKIGTFEIKDIYEDLKAEINDVRYFYDNLMNEIESTIYMAPSAYLLARNISFVYQMLDYANHHLDLWYENIKKSDRVRVAIIHNNLSLDHFLNNTLISWDNAKIGLPIIDLYKLYKSAYNEYDWNELLDIYSETFPLKEDEIFLFKTLIAIPLKVKLTSIEIDNVREVNEKLNYLKLTSLFLTKKSETEK